MPAPLRILSPLHRATRQISLHLEELFRDLPIQGSEGHVLSFLASYAPASCGELARVFGLKPSTLTSLLDRLVERGLVTREVDPEDRRSVLVALTRDGKRTALRIDRGVRSFERRVLARLGPEDLRGFEAVIAAIAEETRVVVRPPRAR